MATILLDAGLLGLACSEPRGRNPADDTEGIRFRTWLQGAVFNHEFVIADVTRCEVRRELIRLNADAKLRRLENITALMTSAAVTMDEWDRAAELWATVRRRGKPTAGAEALRWRCDPRGRRPQLGR